MMVSPWFALANVGAAHDAEIAVVARRTRRSFVMITRGQNGLFDSDELRSKRTVTINTDRWGRIVAEVNRWSD